MGTASEVRKITIKIRCTSVIQSLSERFFWEKVPWRILRDSRQMIWLADDSRNALANSSRSGLNTAGLWEYLSRSYKFTW
ncbi:hypothetical protein M404DRAFT_1004376 [Pisolithus tinctorius Marx 270]|uniref:Uncharacterized protein n=1 Tax=Pisolithus tinctorius Marx 270 TaxID=870435 RepID=A0A0C3NXK9_PISTI|nr:hypothetical protein M404DRAFT_1004376 [Pisolithus tinctorius Marx 270]